jgi:chloride channel protein, CIC family
MADGSGRNSSGAVGSYDVTASSRRSRRGVVTTGDAATGQSAAATLISAMGWLRRSRGGLFAIALVVGAASGLGAVGFRSLIYFFTWLATGHVQFGQQGRVPSAHFPWLGLGFFVVIPVVGGFLYGPLIYRFAREARGHGVPEVMIAVADNGGRIRPQVAGVKALASALCIGAGGSVGREGPIVQIGSALASSLGQWIRMPENRLRVLVACGAAGGIAATFNAPITGVFFGVEIILREFSIEAIFTVMLSAMVADVISRQFLGAAPFLSGFPPGIALDHARNYLLIAALAVIAALLGLGFKNVLYKTEDVCDRVWKQRPEWARPAVGGVVLGLLLLAVPQMYGVGYPVMYKAVAGSYALWFLIVLALTKIIATSLTIGIGGSGGVFAPSLFIGATAGMAFGVIANHVLGSGAGQPALYAVVAMGAVFASAARAPLTSLASVVEMTGDYTLTLPVMLAVAIATVTSRALSYGTIYTTKLLRRGTDIDRTPSADPFEKLTAADAMRPFRPPFTTKGPRPGASSAPSEDPAGLPGPLTHQRDPQVLFANESLTQALRQLVLYGRDGLPVLSTDGQHLQGWITSQDVLQAIAHHIDTAQAAATAHLAAEQGFSHQPFALDSAPTPLQGYRILEVTIEADSPAAGHTLRETTWPPGWVPVSLLDNHTLRDADPELTLAPGDRINLLAHAQAEPALSQPGDEADIRPDIALPTGSRPTQGSAHATSEEG